jgi:hypothetical protein
MHNVFWVKPEGMRNCAREHNIETDLKHTGWEDMHEIHLARKDGDLRTVVNTQRLASKQCGEFYGLDAISLSNTLLPVVSVCMFLGKKIIKSRCL